MGYLRARFRERSFWLGSFVAVGSLAAFWFWRQEVFALVSTVVSGFVAAAPDRALKVLVGLESVAVRRMRDIAWASPGVGLVVGGSGAAVVAAPGLEGRALGELTSLAVEIERVTLVAIEAFFANGPLASDEKAAAAAVIAAFRSQKAAEVMSAVDAVLKVISDLKAQLAAAAPPIAGSSSGAVQ